MRTLLLCSMMISVLALAVWAYRENHATRMELERVVTLQSDVAQAKSRLRVLNAEWAYLNRPERLQELVNLVDSTVDGLLLISVSPNQFIEIDQIPYVRPVAVDIQNSGQNSEEVPQ